MPNIILASGSPRRKQLLEWAEIDFQIVTRDTPETWPPGLPVPVVPVHIARNKALAVQAAITATPDLAITATPDLAITATPDLAITATPDLAITATPDLAITASPQIPAAQTTPIIIAADTVVVLGDEIIGKPRDREDAISILSRLAGRRHEVITGVALLKGDVERSFADTTSVWFHDLTQQEIANYVDRYQPFDKAGAYAIQEWIGVVGIRRIEGDFYNVMGLPVSRVVRALRQI